MISVMPRFVKGQNGLRPFQKDILNALQSQFKLIIVEAPVGAGKSYIIRKLIEDDRLSGFPIILTYPTKILMNVQIGQMNQMFQEN
jgi:superfamily II DNA or RNA helicase